MLRLAEGHDRLLITAPSGWVIEDVGDLPVCPTCWAYDLDPRGGPYPRSSWLQAWRVLCPIHGCLLDSLSAMRSRKRTTIRKSSALSKSIKPPRPPGRMRLGRPPLPKLSIAHALRAVGEMEQTITLALSGVSPHPKYWGPIDGDAFTAVVRDVTTFLLTNFSDRRLTSLVSLDLQRFAAASTVRCFVSSPRYGSRKRAPIGTLVTLAHIVDPAARRAALFWTRELMHTRSMRHWNPKVNYVPRARRQVAILQHQNDEGLAWLIERSNDWPADYRKRWWGSFANVLIR
jgi:hypothetical protein